VSPFPFFALYLACLGICLAGVEGLKAGWVSPEQAVTPQPIAGFIAVPPKPEGARPLQGEGEGEEAYTRQRCLELSSDYRDACFSALAWQLAQRDPDGALASCEEVASADSRWECVSDVAELHALESADRSETICKAIPKKRWHDQCFFGLGLAYAKREFQKARGYCEQAGMWRDFCRHDVNGEIAQVDPEAGLAFCDLEQGTLLQRKTCYHGLGKYLGRTQPMVALEICSRTPLHEPLYVQNCNHGLGWALAESSEQRALEFCRETAGVEDSCLMGVSAHARRLEPARAIEICQSVEDRRLRDRCLGFAKR